MKNTKYKVGIVFAVLITASILFTLSLSSCDCVMRVSGVVLDEQSRNPLENVSINENDPSEANNVNNSSALVDNSDSIGNFHYRDIAGLCSSVTLYLSKDGYLTKEVELKNGANDTIYLTPRESDNQGTHDS